MASEEDRAVAVLEVADQADSAVDHMVVLEDQDPVDLATVHITDLIIIIITDLCFGDLVVLTDLDTDMAEVALAECLVF